eukprot:2254936-Pyramimonas_sp.AAC.1
MATCAEKLGQHKFVNMAEVLRSAWRLQSFASKLDTDVQSQSEDLDKALREAHRALQKTSQDMSAMASYWDSSDKMVEEKLNEIHASAKTSTQRAGAVLRQPHLDAATASAKTLRAEIEEHPSTKEWKQAMEQCTSTDELREEFPKSFMGAPVHRWKSLADEIH